jgi:uncharacterized protein
MDAAVPADMRARIVERLKAVEREWSVEILFAIESGSRAWGFASPDSDFDVRFIYRHPEPWYTQLTEPRDVIEMGIDEHLIDLNGWDVRKALRLALKSNPALWEWLVSPVTYLERGPFRAEARSLFQNHAGLMRVAGHYWSIARTQWTSEIAGRDDPKLKKYFYCVRPLLSLQYVLEHRALPPMAISELLAATDMPPEVRAEVEHLLVAKRGTPELGRGNRIGAIDAWILAELATHAPKSLDLSDTGAAGRIEAAERLFRSTIHHKPSV